MLFEKSEIVYHACEWDRNYFSEAARKSLEEVLTKDLEKIEFCFIDGLL